MTDAFSSATVDLGHGVAVEFRYGDGRMDAVWSPRMPYGRRARQIMPAYRRARHAFLSKVANKLGIVIAVADVGPDLAASAPGEF